MVGLWRFPRLNATLRALLLLVLISILTEMAARWFHRHHQIQNVVYVLYTALEFALLTYIFARAIQPFYPAAFFRVVLVSFLLFILVDALWISGLGSFNSYSTVLEGLLMIFFALSFFYKTLLELQIKHIEREPIVWISVGVLLYFSSSLLIFLFTNYFDPSNNGLFILWGVHGIFNIVHLIFYTLALWIQPAE